MAEAADLAKIDRKIAKEPKYEGQPLYALMVFGKDASPRVLMVLNGNTLCVDPNGNGDLTETEANRSRMRRCGKCVRRPGMTQKSSASFLDPSKARQARPSTS